MPVILLKLITWFAGQLAVLVFIQYLVRQQTNVLLYMRENVGRPNDIEGPLHQYNIRMGAVVAVIISLFQLFFCSWYQALLFGVLCFPFWSFFFDRLINKGLGNDKNYIGTGADIDQQITKLLGTNAGRKKNMYCVILIVLLNLVSIALILFSSSIMV